MKPTLNLSLGDVLRPMLAKKRTTTTEKKKKRKEESEENEEENKKDGKVMRGVRKERKGDREDSWRKREKEE